MRTHSFLYLCLFSILFWVSCKTLEPDRPEEIYVPFSRPPDLSVIQLPVALEAQQIMELLNENLNGLIYEDAEDAEDQILAKIWKQGDIKLSIQGNTVFWEIPLRVWVKAGYSLKQLGISLHEQKEFNAEVLMKFRTNTELLPSGEIGRAHV